MAFMRGNTFAPHDPACCIRPYMAVTFTCARLHRELAGVPWPGVCAPVPKDMLP